MAIFPDDNDKLVWIKKDAIAHLPREVKKIYTDFCVIKNGKFGCPKSFNQLTASWYLNHSKRPNVRCDENYNFFALREIKRGEELTVDYLKYSRK